MRVGTRAGVGAGTRVRVRADVFVYRCAYTCGCALGTCTRVSGAGPCVGVRRVRVRVRWVRVRVWDCVGYVYAYVYARECGTCLRPSSGSGVMESLDDVREEVRHRREVEVEVEKVGALVESTFPPPKVPPVEEPVRHPRDVLHLSFPSSVQVVRSTRHRTGLEGRGPRHVAFGYKPTSHLPFRRTRRALKIRDRGTGVPLGTRGGRKRNPSSSTSVRLSGTNKKDIMLVG